MGTAAAAALGRDNMSEAEKWKIRVVGERGAEKKKVLRLGVAQRRRAGAAPQQDGAASQHGAAATAPWFGRRKGRETKSGRCVYGLQ